MRHHRSTILTQTATALLALLALAACQSGSPPPASGASASARPSASTKPPAAGGDMRAGATVPAPLATPGPGQVAGAMAAGSTATAAAPVPVAPAAAPTAMSAGTIPSGASPPPAGTPPSMDAYADCVMARMPTYDDGVSDAATVARALNAACASLYPNRRGPNLDVTTEAVLRDRNARKAGVGSAAWQACIQTQMKSRDVYRGAIEPLAASLATACKGQYGGEPGRDVAVLEGALRSIRAERPDLVR